MTSTDVSIQDIDTTSFREVPVDWEALEDAFENNAPEVHSYLHLPTGDVLRVVDGVADPHMHARIRADSNYQHVVPVSSREQYRWMERYIPIIEEPELRDRLASSIDGRGAFRRFKDVLMSHGVERERWFNFRTERLRTFMEAWLVAHALCTVPRPLLPTAVESETRLQVPLERGSASGSIFDVPSRFEGAAPPLRYDSDILKGSLRQICERLSLGDLETLVAFATFLRARQGESVRSATTHERHSNSISSENQPSEPPVLMAPVDSFDKP